MKLRFVCSADFEHGFGHAQRCAHLARLVMGRRENVQVTFQGRFSSAARARLSKLVADARFEAEDACGEADVAVMDRLGNPADLDSYRADLVAAVSGNAERYVHIASGLIAPPLPRGICIGYQPGGPPAQPPSLLWGLEYAPVGPGLCAEAGNCHRVSGRILIALGAHPTDAPLRLALAAAEQLDGVGTIDVLVSPLLEQADPVSSRPLHLHRNLPSIAGLLARAEIAVVSYGNICFEALALGTPICILAQKPFQALLGQRLESRGLAVFGGSAATVSAGDLACALGETLSRSKALSAAGRRTVDDRGLGRIAEILCGEIVV